MQLTTREQRQLFIAVAASVHGALMAGKATREKPLAAAQKAQEHAAAAVLNNKLARKRS